MFQELDEVKRIVADWGKNICPADMVHSERNAQLLADYCFLQFGTISASLLTKAYNARHDELDLIPPPTQPKQLTQDEQAAIFQAKEFARIQKETLENSIPFSERFSKAEKTKRETEAEAKRQTDAKGALVTAISSYQCYLPSGKGVDYLTTEMVQDELRAVKVGNDFVRTLAAVNQIIQELPDHPKSGDVNRVVGILNARLKK